MPRATLTVRYPGQEPKKITGLELPIGRPELLGVEWEEPPKPECNCNHICYRNLVHAFPPVALTDPKEIRCKKEDG